MKIGDLIKRLDETGVAVGTKLNNIIRSQIASDLLAQVKLRIQTTGINAQGVMFKAYSRKPTLVGYSDYPVSKKAFTRIKAREKARIKKGRKMLSGAIESNWRTVKGRDGKYHKLIIVDGGYEEIRRIAGYQTAYKDFTVTGSMFRGVKVKSASLENGIIEIIYGSTDARTETLLRKHSFREKINIIAPSKQELKNIENIIGKYIENEIKRQLNG